MRIVIIEDDHLQYEWVKNKIDQDQGLSGAVTVERISTESEFRERFQEIATNPPDIIIIDVMLRWRDPTPQGPLMPKEVKEGGFYRAGLRCEKMLAEDKRTSQITVIIYTVLSKEDLGNEIPDRVNVTFLSKDSELQPLLQEVRKIVGSK